jgi:CheY-like chemotaxis protein
LIIDILSKTGCLRKGKVLNDGEEVLDYLDSINDGDDFPALIVMDNNMPRLSGEATLMLLKKDDRYKSIPVAIYTTTLTPLKEKAFLNYGAVSVREKPRDIKGISSLIMEYVSMAKLTDNSMDPQGEPA